jgi:2-phosphosulfolactate phosphatase
VVIVDVLSFSTAVEVATARGAEVHPVDLDDEAAQEAADVLGAVLAARRVIPAGGAGPAYSLSPASLMEIPPGTRLVLPSPNGAALSLRTGDAPTIAGCLRNASAVARAAAAFGPRISVIAAGERWPDGSLRVALEDWLGAGAIIAHLAGERSPEAEAAADAFRAAAPHLAKRLEQTASSRELIERGFAEDVQIAAEHDVSVVVPVLRDGAYTARSR